MGLTSVSCVKVSYEQVHHGEILDDRLAHSWHGTLMRGQEAFFTNAEDALTPVSWAVLTADKRDELPLPPLLAEAVPYHVLDGAGWRKTTTKLPPIFLGLAFDCRRSGF